jgi:hypothetical protein
MTPSLLLRLSPVTHGGLHTGEGGSFHQLPKRQCSLHSKTRLTLTILSVLKSVHSSPVHTVQSNSVPLADTQAHPCQPGLPSSPFNHLVFSPSA